MNRPKGLFNFWLALCLMCGEVAAQTPQQQPARKADLASMNLEDLMNIKVTSVSKEEQKMSKVAAAIFVITQEDISRSGATNIPDLLRMVPGLDVSQINANSWAVSARGFNQQFTNKLLVLIDGRAVYSPLLGGVNWDTQDVPLEDIDRIEVIRGPGATIWGANAVNGVINVVTKKAVDTMGGLITAGGGTEGQAYATARYGGSFRGTNYRVFTKYFNHGALHEIDGNQQADGWNLLHGGFRADTRISTKDSMTTQGDIYNGREGAGIVHIHSIDPPVVDDEGVRYSLSGGNILGRWNHTFSSRADTTLQFYFDNYSRTGPSASETRNTIDFDFTHHFAWGSRQDLVWGLGYRRTWDETHGTIDQSFIPSDAALRLFNTFVQDTVALDPHALYLTVGAKLENNYFTGFDLVPSISLTWTPSNWQTFWVMAAKAERTPARRDVGLVAPLAVFPDPAGSGFPAELVLYGNPQIRSEDVVAYEAGYRMQPNGRFSIDASAFFNRYDHLASLEPGPETFQASPAPPRFVIPIIFGNLMHGTTEGGEISANLKLTNRWMLSPSYAFLEMHLHTEPASLDTTSVAEFQGSSPQHQAQLRSHVELFHGLSWDANAYYVSPLPVQPTPSYTRIDTQLKWKLAERMEISLVGQNLLHDHHAESKDALALVNSSQIKRSAYVKVTWKF